MKLKEFDFKLPRDEKRKKKIIITSISVIVLIIIITIASTFAYYQSIENQNSINTTVGNFNSGDITIAMTVDGISVQDVPQQNTGYIGSTITCNNGAIAIWDNFEWRIIIENYTKSKTVCSIAFVLGQSLHEAIVAQGGTKETIEAKGSPNFNSAPIAATSGLYATEDEYGMSYYYRGMKTSLNNNLIFAGFQWKIVRINGDDSIRIIYNGTESQFNSAKEMNTTGADTELARPNFNSSTNDNRYLGYMYGNTSSSPLLAQTNINNSAIKTYLDGWYVSNIETKSSYITEKIHDNLFCGDRSIKSGSGTYNSTTLYGAYDRFYTNVSSLKPTLKCLQQNDRFTVDDTNIGNAALTYPIGLISADEVAYGGVYYNSYDGTNMGSNSFLTTGSAYYTMSPSLVNSSTAFVWNVYPNGSLYSNSDSPVSATRGARPVINLNSSTRIMGSGSATDPFRIV